MLGRACIKVTGIMKPGCDVQNRYIFFGQLIVGRNFIRPLHYLPCMIDTMIEQVFVRNSIVKLDDSIFGLFYYLLIIIFHLIIFISCKQSKRFIYCSYRNIFFSMLN